LPQTRQCLNSGQLGSRKIHLKLQQLQFDFQQVAFAHGSGLEFRLANLHGLLEARQVLLREIKIGLGKQRSNELLRDVGRQSTFVVRHRCRGYGRLIARSFQPALPLLAALDQVGKSQVEHGTCVHVIMRKRAGREKRQVLLIDKTHRIGPQIRRDFLRLILRDHRARRQQRMIVFQREVNRLIERHARGRILRRGLR